MSGQILVGEVLAFRLSGWRVLGRASASRPSIVEAQLNAITAFGSCDGAVVMALRCRPVRVSVPHDGVLDSSTILRSAVLAGCHLEVASSCEPSAASSHRLRVGGLIAFPTRSSPSSAV